MMLASYDVCPANAAVHSECGPTNGYMVKACILLVVCWCLWKHTLYAETYRGVHLNDAAGR